MNETLYLIKSSRLNKHSCLLRHSEVDLLNKMQTEMSSRWTSFLATKYDMQCVVLPPETLSFLNIITLYHILDQLIPLFSSFYTGKQFAGFRWVAVRMWYGWLGSNWMLQNDPFCSSEEMIQSIVSIY